MGGRLCWLSWLVLSSLNGRENAKNMSSQESGRKSCNKGSPEVVAQVCGQDEVRWEWCMRAGHKHGVSAVSPWGWGAFSRLRR